MATVLAATSRGRLAILIMGQGLGEPMVPEGEAGRRPWVVLNFAMSADGKMALATGAALDISCSEDLMRVHQLRASVDAILVGVGTIVADDPKLYVNPSRVPDPPALTKIVLDASGRTPPDARFLSTPGRSVVATVEGTASALRERLGDRATVLPCGQGPLVDLPQLMDGLVGMGVGRLMVEGGGETLWGFVSQGLFDEYSVYIGPIIVGGDTAPTPCRGPGVTDASLVVPLEMVSAERLGEGLWVRYRAVRPR